VRGCVNLFGISLLDNSGQINGAVQSHGSNARVGNSGLVADGLLLDGGANPGLLSDNTGRLSGSGIALTLYGGGQIHNSGTISTGDFQTIQVDLTASSGGMRLVNDGVIETASFTGNSLQICSDATDTIRL
jgi:hypothetical protein